MKEIKSVFIRYLIILLIAIPNLYLFYFIFTPLTIYPLFGFFKIFFNDISLVGNIFNFSGVSIEIIKACIGGSAYYLLFILNLSIPKIKFSKRLKMILFSFTLLLVLNIIRIFTLSIVFISKPYIFDWTHKLFWYLGATVFVVLIWFIEVKMFKIKEIPIYSDMKLMFKKD